ncbi:MAG: carbohydrate ABC transporter permease [Spirochaetaceae bacterium]|jgi:arabinosaccharide transport system permease protein|nr:carbohydrate ABC transporter permease [Spirochaetaceae bacterium]
MSTLYRQKKYGSLKVQASLYTFLGMLFFSVLCALIVAPIVTFVIASFRPGQDLIRNGLSLGIDPDRMSLKNYLFLFTGKHSYFMWFKNSLLLTIVQVTLSLLVCYIVAYGLAMYVFKLKNILFFLVIATMMVPFEILMLPLYVEIIALKLIDSFAGVILPGLCGAATIFFFRQYMQGLPKGLLDAGRIDGANEYRICFTIMLPLVKPAFAAMGILSAMGSWNNMLWPLLVFRNASKFTLPIGLNTLLTPYGNDYDLLIAGSVFSVIPIFVLFLLFQQYFIGGMTAGAIKE